MTDDDRRSPGRPRKPVPGAGARSAEIPDVAVPDDHAIGRDITRDPAPSEATMPGAGALPPEAYRTGGPTGTRPVPPGTGAPLPGGAPPDAGEPPSGAAGDRRGGAGRSGGAGNPGDDEEKEAR